MIFRLVKPETINLPVPMESPDGQAGTILLEIKYLKQSEVKALLEELFPEVPEPGDDNEDGAAPKRPRATMTDLELAKRLAVGWQRVADEDGEEIPWSVPAFEDAMDLRYFHNAVGMALVEHLVGGRKKNFSPLVVSGQEESTT